MRLSKTHKIGSVIPHGVKPAPHEWETILFFTELGKDVELIMPSNTPYNKNADYIIDGIAWEAKSPTNNQSLQKITLSFVINYTIIKLLRATYRCKQ